MSKQPKAGDIVTIRGVVRQLAGGARPFCTMKPIDCDSTNIISVYLDTIATVEEGPLQVGDTVWYDGAPYEGGTLLFIHEDTDEQAVAYGNAKRQWGVVAYKGDMPKSFFLHQIRKTR